MKTIKDPEFSHIKKLLESTNEDDVLIGLNLLKKSKISNKGLLKSFPSKAVPDWDFKNNSDLVGWIRIKKVEMAINDCWIYAVETNSIFDSHRKYYKEIEL